MIIENDKNLCPFFDIGIALGKDATNSSITIQKGESTTVINNGIILTPTGSKMNNTLSNSKINLAAFNMSGNGAISFIPSNQDFNFVVGQCYAIIYDVTGTTSLAPSFTGFTDLIINESKTTPILSKNISSDAGANNLNCYYIFYYDGIINKDLTIYNNFMIGWTSINGATINLQLETFQVYNVTEYGIKLEDFSDFEKRILPLLKSYTYISGNTNKYYNNGIIQKTNDSIIEE